MLVEERRFDQVAGEIETSHTLIEASGERESITYRVRTYTATELVRLVAEAGFTGIECYGGLEGEALEIDTRLVVLARAPE